jgi:hypothetical protein
MNSVGMPESSCSGGDRLERQVLQFIAPELSKRRSPQNCSSATPPSRATWPIC